MKKFLSWIMVLVTLLSTVTVWADESSSKEMEKVLLAVKEKVEIPTELTEFTPRTFEHMKQDKKSYSFMWSDKKGNSYMEVTCDDKGRITNYYFYDNKMTSDKKLTKLSKNDIVSFGESFLKKTVPEAFVSDNDKLVFDENTWNVNNLTYTLRFKRMRDGIEVKDNEASVRVYVWDDVPYVKSADVYVKYDSSFEAIPQEVQNFEDMYKKAFPIELIYKDENVLFAAREKEEEEKKTVLVYRHKDNETGYILVSSGEVATEDELSDIYGGGGSNGALKSEAAMDSAAREELFTEKELEELGKIEGLLSKEKVRELLERLPHTGFEKELVMSGYGIQSMDEKYRIVAEFSDNEARYVSAALDGISGELFSIYNSVPYVRAKELNEITETQKNEVNKKIDEFLDAAAGEKMSEFSEQSRNVSAKNVNRDYDRTVNGVRYINDGIYVDFDVALQMISSYRLDYDEKRIFAKPEGVLDSEKAYDAILDYSPLKKLYVHTGGSYKACYTVSEYGTEIDAFTGEKYNSYYGYETNGVYKYSDLSGHWAEEKINKLAEVQIGFEGEEFNPDEYISQYDLLRLFAAGIRYKSYLDYSEDDLYNEFINEKILAEDEKAPDGKVNREDAFVYMVRLDGLERVAKLYSIFKVEYADGNMIAKEKTGYPAILTGMNIICGDGGYLRPKDGITRAEAASMVYNYMMR